MCASSHFGRHLCRDTAWTGTTRATGHGQEGLAACPKVRHSGTRTLASNDQVHAQGHHSHCGHQHGKRSHEMGQTLGVETSKTFTRQVARTCSGNMKQRPMRKILRESKTEAKKAILQVSPKNFYIYPVNCIKRTVYEESYDDDRNLRKRFTPVPLQH